MARPMFSLSFWADALERAAKSAAQGILTALAASDTGPANLFEFNFANAAGFGLGMAALSILTSIISAPIGQTGTASMLPPPIGPEAPDPPPGG